MRVAVFAVAAERFLPLLRMRTHDSNDLVEREAVRPLPEPGLQPGVTAPGAPDRPFVIGSQPGLTALAADKVIGPQHKALAGFGGPGAVPDFDRSAGSRLVSCLLYTSRCV